MGCSSRSGRGRPQAEGLAPWPEAIIEDGADGLRDALGILGPTGRGRDPRGDEGGGAVYEHLLAHAGHHVAWAPLRVASAQLNSRFSLSPQASPQPGLRVSIGQAETPLGSQQQLAQGGPPL